MKLTRRTAYKILGMIIQCYPTCGSKLEPDFFISHLQEVVPEELAEDMARVYRQHRAKGPESAVDFVDAYIEYQLENAESVGEVIDKIVSGINHYYSTELYESSYSDCDEYITQVVIPMLPCPVGVKVFYDRNKYYLDRLARYCPEPDEWKTIYKKLDYEYRNQLITVERRSILEMINNTALPTGNNNIRLEA